MVKKDKAETSPVAFGYARISTAGQVAGLSMTAQRENIEAYYRRVLEPAGVRFGDVFQDVETKAGSRDGVSGKKKLGNRIAGGALVSRLRPGDHVVANDMTRLFRNFADAVVVVEGWIEKGIYLHLVRESIDTSTAPGRMFVRFMALFAQMEREMVSERTREALRVRKAAGMVQGTAKYGTRYEGIKGHRRVVTDEHEVETIKEIIRLHEEEGRCFKEIYRLFLLAKIKTRKGKRWSLSRIWRAYDQMKEKKVPAGKGSGSEG